ncbi:discoidin domain-containing protein [Wenjunlia tyrosinilytica]|uniref:Carbohydrate-binding protein n=1 Tax=Wenjunlia tyrosinilytica TaxID=1544741 RepID=A0A918DVU0_9ACTN|nr:discoidin domain-containing protein [Wenjunlia tyrosinilytica]GGO83873.1 carbohydrate-binding protein [Wenjunlia tyrosinilytica]
MSRRSLAATVTTVCLLLLTAFAGLLNGAPSAQAATTQQTFLTFYGWYDNTPPGGDISYPQIHDTAGGKGTFSDPITFATTSSELAPGTKVWVPRVKKYFIMEDDCQECGEDWNGHGPNGGPKLWHLDLWLGGKGGNAMDAIDCEDALTHYNADNTPTMEPVVIDPPSNEPYDATPIFNTGTGECYGGAQPNTTVGQYKNGSTGQCLDDPGNSSTSGTALKTAACTGAANQRFTFHGAFLLINDLCAAMSGSNIVLKTCNGGPAQQWSINPSGTISDIQTGQKCFRASGGNVVAGSCSGAASQWAFTASGSKDFSLSLNPSSGAVGPGASTTSTVSVTSSSGSTDPVSLSATGAPSGVTVSFAPASVVPGGTSTMTISTTAAAASGSSTLTVTGTSASGTHSAAYGLTVNGSGGGDPVLLSQGKAATTSSVESSSYPASAAFDGNLTSTRWASKEGVDPQWLRVDLGATANISRVKLTWEAAYGKAYTIQTSPDGTTWTTVYSTTSGNGATDDLTGLTGTGRYVRVNGTARGTAYGYSLYEMQVYGTTAPAT